MSSSERRWYPVQTQAQRESLAARQLENQGYAVFYPRRQVSVRHARRLRQREASYFPGYIFVALDLKADHWRSVNGTFGVKSLVMFGGRPAAAPGGFVELLRGSTDERGHVSPLTKFHPGDRVTILCGPFADIMGMIDRLDGPSRVRVLMDMVSGTLPLLTTTRNIALAS